MSDVPSVGTIMSAGLSGEDSVTEPHPAQPVKPRCALPLEYQTPQPLSVIREIGLAHRFLTRVWLLSLASLPVVPLLASGFGAISGFLVPNAVLMALQLIAAIRAVRVLRINTFFRIVAMLGCIASIVFPVFGMLMLLPLNTEGNRALRRAGIPCGLMGLAGPYEEDLPVE